MDLKVVGFPKKPMANVIDIAAHYFQSRGLTEEMLKVMNVEVMTLDALKRSKLNVPVNEVNGSMGFGAVGAVVFPVDGDSWMCRLLFDPNYQPSTPAPGDSVKKKPNKYLRPVGSTNCVYFPPHVTDWYSEGVEYDLFIVEGALNAVRLAAEGYHAIAIQGINNYHIQTKHTGIIPELERIVKATNPKTITYIPDSDTGDVEAKPVLYHAINSFLLVLLKLRKERSDTIYICRPPSNPDGTKNGADDYFHKVGHDEFRRLIRDERKRFADMPYLRAEREAVGRYILYEPKDIFLDTKIHEFIKPEHFNNNMKQFGLLDDLYSKRQMYYNQDRVRHDSTGLRRATHIGYKADQGDFYIEEDSGGRLIPYVNKFNPDDIPKPVKGSVAIFDDILLNICEGDQSLVDRIKVIAAFHAQFPDRTPKYALMLLGDQGCGKSLVATSFGLALSKRFSKCRVNLDSPYTDTYLGYAAREWEEVYASMGYEWYKSLVTQRDVEINTKFGYKWTQPNTCLHIFTVNQMKSIIQEGDRRTLIAGWGRKHNELLGIQFEKWVLPEYGGMGPNYLRHHLLYDIDASSYDTLDVTTKLKTGVIEASKTYRETICDLVKEQLSEMEGFELAHNALIEEVLRPHDVRLESFNKQFAMEFIPPCRPIISVGGNKIRFRAFRNHEKWRSETNTEEYLKQYAMSEAVLKKIQNGPGRKY